MSPPFHQKQSLLHHLKLVLPAVPSLHRGRTAEGLLPSPGISTKVGVQMLRLSTLGQETQAGTTKQRPQALSAEAALAGGRGWGREQRHNKNRKCLLKDCTQKSGE